jgi:hypothetical protein
MFSPNFTLRPLDLLNDGIPAMVLSTEPVGATQPTAGQPSDRGIVCFKDVFNPIALELLARQFEGNLALGAA